MELWKSKVGLTNFGLSAQFKHSDTFARRQKISSY